MQKYDQSLFWLNLNFVLKKKNTINNKYNTIEREINIITTPYSRGKQK